MARRLALVNADAWTLEEPGSREPALYLEDGKVSHVGPEASVLARAHRDAAPVEDLEGRTVLPGLIDGHAHLVHQGLLADRLDLWDTRTKEEALARVRRAAARHRGPDPLLAERWDESRWRKPHWPTRDELDAVSRRIPIILRRIDGHVAVANTVACRALAGRLEGVDPERGLLIEEASLQLNRVYPASVAQAVRALERAQARALELGITGLHDFAVPNYIAAYAELRRRGRLRLRVRATPYLETLDALAQTGLATGFGDDALELGGIKVFADGSIGGHTAALAHPYEDDPDNEGRLNWSDADLKRIVQEAARSGLQPSIHAIGDRAITQVLGAYATLAPARRRRLRPRVEHFELHTPQHVREITRLGAVASMQPNFIGEWSLPGGLYPRRLGRRRAVHNNEFRRLQEAGVRLAFGSDCMPLDPWFGLEACVRAPYAAQRLPLEDAVRAYTSGAAWGLGWERRTGRLARGLAADLIVVQADWRRPQGVRRAQVDKTMIGGRWAFERRGRRASPALKSRI